MTEKENRKRKKWRNDKNCDEKHTENLKKGKKIVLK
jgi:hypothetical protein